MARKILANLFITLDGVVESPEKWSSGYWNDEIQNAMSGGMFDSEALVLGRVTYQTFAESWGSRSSEDDPGTEHMNSVRKYVASRTLSTVEWNNSQLLQGDTTAAVAALKAEEGGDVAVSGSPSLVVWLLEQGLLDELQLLIYPVVLGKGKQLFRGVTEQQVLTVASCTAFSNGVLHVVYRPAAS
ncbi:MAG: dihydrofolate reductase family protein [Propionibacteriaceae bacterium]